MTIDFRTVSARGGDGARLLAAMEAEMHDLYDGLDLNAPDMPKAGPNELSPPGGRFLVGYRGGEAVCAGGLKRLDDAVCEIKRMYVVPGARGQGLAVELLAALETAARNLGYSIARLDTGPRQPHARQIYLDAGYREVDNFNQNPAATFFGEKSL